MICDRRVVVVGMLVAVAACHHRVAPPPAPPASDLVVLVPDPEDGGVGAATVSTPQGQVQLTAAQHATRIVVGQAPSAPTVMTSEEVDRRFGALAAARPLPPREFLLYFELGGDTLTAESQAQVADIIAFVRSRPVPDVSIIGHTDTTGSPARNAGLGLERATLIRDLLVKSGLDPALVEVASHGEADLLVPTPDDTPEPRNRRVEVTVR